MLRNATRAASAVGVAVLSLLSLGGGASAHEPPPGNETVIKNASSGQQLIPTGFGENYNDEIPIWAWPQQTKGRYWQMLSQGNSVYMIRNKETGKCMAVSHAGWNSNYVVQRTCSHYADDQMWSIRATAGSRGSTIINKSTNEAITPYYTNAGSWAVLTDAAGVDTQLWRFSN